MTEVIKCKYCTELTLVTDIEALKNHFKEYHKIEDLEQFKLEDLYEVYTLNPKNKSSTSFIPGQKIFSGTVKVGGAISKWLTTKREDKKA